MSCEILTKLPVPQLPFPFTFGAAIPLLPPINIPFPCCTQPLLAVPPVSIPIPSLVVNPAFVKTLQGYLAALDKYIDTLQLPCPRD